MVQFRTGEKPGSRKDAFLKQEAGERVKFFAEVKAIAEALAVNLPDGILSITVHKETDGRPFIRIDSTDNASLDPFAEKVEQELQTQGLKLGEHISMGFEGNEQAEGWYVVADEV